VENNGAHMQHQARSVLDYGIIYGFKEFMKEIDDVTATQMMDISNEIFAPEKISVLIYQQEK
jgi:predicted Zn-dependent peptidase